ncbi:MAG TPA: hypothetical protein VF843_06180, partial [Streptosporangiaceae bacterium]
EELAGLAPLPALLRRVPPEEAERIAASAPDMAEHDAEPPAEILDSLLARTAARRRSRRYRAMFTAAAAVLVAAGGAAAVGETLASSPPHHQVAEISTARDGAVTAVVRYGRRTWGTAMSVRVAGVPQQTNCRFYVITKDGRRLLAGAWTVGPRGDSLWYPVATPVPVSQLSSFVLIAGHHRPLRMPAI